MSAVTDDAAWNFHHNTREPSSLRYCSSSMTINPQEPHRQQRGTSVTSFQRAKVYVTMHALKTRS